MNGIAIHKLIWQDYVRLLALAITLSAIASFPLAVFRQGRHWSAALAVAGCELFMLGTVLAISDHFGIRPFKWYRTPLALVAGSLILAFNIYVFMANHRKDHS